MPKPRIIIVGGGFAGVKCARTLRARLAPREAEIVLFNQENHLVFHPLLAEVVGSSLNPEAIAAPLRQMLPAVSCRTEEVRSVALLRSEVEYEGHDGQLRRLAYDHVVIACGARVNLGTVPGMADHAFPMKTIGDAIALRAHIMAQMEKAEVCEALERKRWYLSFVIVGGGYSGVEAAGEINDLVRSSRRFYQNIGPEDISVTIIHSRDHLLPEIGPALRVFARAKMEQAGIKVLLNCRVALATPKGVGLADGRMIAGATVVCTIGSTTAPVVQALPVPKEKGRLKTEPDMRLPGFANAWAVGDCAQVINSFDQQPAPPTGQFAEREGRQVAENIARALRGEPTRPFRFKQLGQLCSIGGHKAVAEVFGVRLSGFFAWFVWRGVYLFKLPSWSRRIKVGFDWAWQLVFARDLSHLKANLTERVAHAHYQAGDFVFRQGDPATDFFIIERGEVEIVRDPADRQPEQVVAVLGPGSFFGELALVTNEPRSAGVRARTPLDVVVVGRTVFDQMSRSLAPLRDLLSETIQRRRGTAWQNAPAVREWLQRAPLADFIEAIPQPLLRASASFESVVRHFEEQALEFCYVSSDGSRLDGVVTRTDLFRALEAGTDQAAPAERFMRADPIAVTAADTVLTAVSTMRDHRLKSLPILEDRDSRRLVGCVKSHTIFARVVRHCLAGRT